MNLFRIIVLHGAPKDSHTSTETYLVAQNEEAVAEWINQTKCSGYWFDDETTRSIDDNDVPFRDWVLKNRGDLTDEEGWEDAYYGVTKWGWEPIEATPEDIAVLLRLGIAQPLE